MCMHKFIGSGVGIWGWKGESEEVGRKTSHNRALVQILALLLLIQLPANVPGEWQMMPLSSGVQVES